MPAGRESSFLRIGTKERFLLSGDFSPAGTEGLERAARKLEADGSMHDVFEIRMKKEVTIMAIQDPDPGKYEAGSTPGAMRGNGGDIGEQAKSVMGDVGRKAYEAGEGFVTDARERAKSIFSEQKDRAADELNTLADAFRQTSEKLRDQDHEIYAHYAEILADQVERASGYVKQREVGEIIEEVGNLVRRESFLFFGSVFVAGFLVARLLKTRGEGSERSFIEEKTDYEPAREATPLPSHIDIEHETPYGTH